MPRLIPDYAPFRPNLSAAGSQAPGIFAPPSRGSPVPFPPSPKVPFPQPTPPAPTIPEQRNSRFWIIPRQNQAPAAPEPPKPPTITSFFKTIYESIKNIDPEQRSTYLQTTLATIKERLDRYEFRLARGIPLTPDQQQQYNSLKSGFNDIQSYLNNPSAYENVLNPQAQTPTPQGTTGLRQVAPGVFMDELGRIAKRDAPGISISREEFIRRGGVEPTRLPY